MAPIIPRYLTGQKILKGDRIKYVGEDGIVDFVITDKAADWESYWNKLGQGVMLKVPSFGRVYVPFDDEDLEFASRNENSK